MSSMVLERFTMLRGQAFSRHVHADQHQLAWASEGVLLVDAGGSSWVLPPTLALWIPAGEWHATHALRATVLEGVYIRQSNSVFPWGKLTVLSVSPLARHLLEYLREELTEEARARAEAVLADVLSPISIAGTSLPLPQDPRARDVADLLLEDPGDHRSLEALAKAIGSSPRTLLRMFLTETGLTFAQWRVQLRVQAAIAALAEGEPVSRVAFQVGYASSSAFVAAFRKATGHSPGTYLAQAGR